MGTMMLLAAGIDWPVTITAIKDTVLALAAILTAVVALIGLSKWRQELKGRADFETARSYVRATYKLRDEIGSARAPFVRASELPEGYYQHGNDRSDQDEADAWAKVFQSRLNPVQQALQELDVHALEAESLWGANARVGAIELQRCVARLQASMSSSVHDKAIGNLGFESDPDLADKIEKSIFGLIDDEDNPLSKRIRDAIAEIERTVRPYLSRR